MERLLVTGVDGPIGGNLALALADQYDVLGLYDRQAVATRMVATRPCHAGDAPQIEKVIGDWRPQWVIHCGPLSTCSWDATDGQSPIVTAADDAAQWARVAEEASARLTVISSDAVFAGPRMFHEETAKASSPSRQAVAVRAMERSLENTQALVVRTHVYGWSPTPQRAGFAELAVDALTAGRNIAAGGHRHATPILASDLAELLVRAFEARLQGLYHLTGAERTSDHRFLVELAAAFDLRGPATVGDAIPTISAAWHDETSLNSKRARRVLETATPLLRDGLDRFALQARQGLRERWQTVSGNVPTELAA